MDPAPSCGRGALVEAITAFLAHKHPARLPLIREALEKTVDEAGPQAIRLLSERLAVAGSDWTYYPRDPLARRIHEVLAVPVLQQEPSVTGAEHLKDVAGKPLVLVANHLSYSDANAVDVLLQRTGVREVSDRLTVIAGPKVYSNVRRRFSSLCFGTIKVPQSAARSSEEAMMKPRDVALAAQRVIQLAQDRLALGEALLVFAEGTRSRSGQMQPFLPGVARYLQFAGTWVVPMGIAGTEKLFPLAEDSLHPVRLTLTIGRVVPASLIRDRTQGNRKLIMDSLGVAVAALLPLEYRGVYADGVPGLDAARRVCDALFE